MDIGMAHLKVHAELDMLFDQAANSIELADNPLNSPELNQPGISLLRRDWYNSAKPVGVELGSEPMVILQRLSDLCVFSFENSHSDSLARVVIRLYQEAKSENNIAARSLLIFQAYDASLCLIGSIQRKLVSDSNGIALSSVSERRLVLSSVLAGKVSEDAWAIYMADRMFVDGTRGFRAAHALMDSSAVSNSDHRCHYYKSEFWEHVETASGIQL
jgi:hypothetical protein